MPCSADCSLQTVSNSTPPSPCPAARDGDVGFRRAPVCLAGIPGRLQGGAPGEGSVWAGEPWSSVCRPSRCWHQARVATCCAPTRRQHLLRGFTQRTAGMPECPCLCAVLFAMRTYSVRGTQQAGHTLHTPQQAFAILGLARYARSAGDSAAADFAWRVFSSVDAARHDPQLVSTAGQRFACFGWRKQASAHKAVISTQSPRQPTVLCLSAGLAALAPIAGRVLCPMCSSHSVAGRLSGRHRSSLPSGRGHRGQGGPLPQHAPAPDRGAHRVERRAGSIRERHAEQGEGGS